MFVPLFAGNFYPPPPPLPLKKGPLPDDDSEFVSVHSSNLFADRTLCQGR